MSLAGDAKISADENQVEDNAHCEGEHTYDESSSGWAGDIGHSIANDDDEDNWSRQVEMDDTIQRMPSSVTGGETNTIDDDEDGQGTSALAMENTDNPEQQQQSVLIPRPRPQPTLKEKLVERERQRRVESERARWKRQFAMAAHAEAVNDEDDNNNGTTGDLNTDDNITASGAIADNDHSFVTDRNSVAGTVGEDTVAPIDTLEEDNNDQNMTYPMERFLQDQHGTEIVEDSNRGNGNNNNKNETQGVVMERFLKEQPATSANGFVTGESPTLSASAPLRTESIPNDSSVGQIANSGLPLLDLPPDENVANAIESDIRGESIGENMFQSPSQQPRVVLRLTEAEIQEMAAIDDASRSNAPPSERDDISELGELVSDFGNGLPHIDNQNMSQGTPVTAMESVTSSVGNQIGQITVLSASSSDNGIIDGIDAHSVSSNVVASSGGDVSLTGNPPSEIARDDDDDTGGILSPHSSQVPTEILPAASTAGVPLPPFATVPGIDSTTSTDDDEIIVNRTIRPGVFNYKERQQESSVENLPDLYAPKNIASSPTRRIPADVDNHIEGFDFDKNNYVSSPQCDVVTSHDDLWSPGFTDSNILPKYGAVGTEDTDSDIETQRFGARSRTETNVKKNKTKANHETKPLLGGVPPAVNVTVKNHRRESATSWGSLRSIRNMADLSLLAESVFSDIRSESSESMLSISNEAKVYFDATISKRAFPERMFALTVTLIFELPTLFMISGGSDKLCNLIGRTKYTTLIALLPIVSAISGNVGLQASTLTTRSISHGQVQVHNYKSWLVKEIGVAFYLGLGMGLITGSIAFIMGTFSIAFALSIFTAQFVGILTAGFTGTVAPLLFTFIFERDSGKWGGPLETAVQDIVGSFAMIVISYHIMLLFGPYDIAPNDICSLAE